MQIWIQDPKNFHMKPDPDVDPRGKSPNKKNYTNKCSTKSFKMTLKIIKINKQNIILRKKWILTFDLPVLYSPNDPVHFLGFFTSWIRIREAFLNADPDPDPQHRFKQLTWNCFF